MAKRPPRKRDQALTDVLIRQCAAPATGKVQIPDGTVAGMGLRVSHTGQKSFYLTYTHRGRDQRMTLGQYPTLKLAAARSKATALIAMIDAGLDPRAAEKAANQPAAPPMATTFETALQQFVSLYCKRHNKASTAAETERLLRATFLPRWRQRAVASITTADVLDILDDLIGRERPSAAIHAYSNIRTFFGWCESRGLVVQDPCLKLRPPAKKAKRTRVLSDQELARIWHAAQAQGYPYGPIVHLLILTLQRRGEVAGMMLGELSQDRQLWSLPPLRTKNGQPHEVPLLPRARAILHRVPRLESSFVFPARHKLDRAFTGYSPAKRALDAACPIDDWTLHDLRRTGATGLGNLGVPPHIIERILNHTSESFEGVSGLYNRARYFPEMRAALRLWAAHVKKVVKTYAPEPSLGARKQRQRRDASVPEVLP